jgi:hypothetical protein
MGMNLRNDADLTTRIGKTKQIGSSEFINDRRATFDIVYSSAHDGMDTADHFSVGMQMGADEYDLQMEERARERMAAYAVAKENLKKNKLHEHAHMGHEQAEGKGDTFDHFAGGSMNIEADDTNMAFDKIYSEVFTGKDTADHFAPGMGMSLAAEVDRHGPLPAVQAGTGSRTSRFIPVLTRRRLVIARLRARSAHGAADRFAALLRG